MSKNQLCVKNNPNVYNNEQTNTSSINVSKAKNVTQTKNISRQPIKYYDKKATILAFSKHIVYFAMMLLLAFAKSSGGLSPFVLGLLAGLVYCRENVVLLAVEYSLAMMLTGFSIHRLIITIVPPFIFMLAKLIHKLALKSIKMLHINIYSLICQLPVILLNLHSVEQIIHSVCSVIISQIFTYTATIALYAIIVRGMKYKLAKDELFGACTLIIALSIGLFSIKIYKVMPFYVVSTFVVLMLIFSENIGGCFVGALSLGIGAGLNGGNIMIVGGIVLPLAIALIFAKSNIYYGVFAYIIGDIFVGAYFSAFGKYDIFHLLAVCLGAVIFLIIPNKVKEHLVHTFGGGTSKNAEHSMVIRNRAEVSKKLTDMAKVFAQIGSVLGGAEFAVSANNSLELANEIAIEHCATCPNYKFCSSMLGGDTSIAIKDVVDKAMYNGMITCEDLSPFLQSRCTRQEALINLVADKSQKLMKLCDKKNQIGAGRIILGEQMLSLSSLLKELGGEIKNSVFFDAENEQNIISELYYENIVCRDIVVSGENGAFGVVMTVRHKDSFKSALVKVVSKVLKADFQVIECVQSKIYGFDVVTLRLTPRFNLAYGIATRIMDGSRASGDTYSICKIAYDKTMLVLCDGMGSGENANFNSTSTIGMIENFYKAGFNNNAILSLINKILATYNSESFTCLDMAMIDLTKGVVDIIKLGGTESLIIRNDKCVALGGGALPLGIVEEAKPYTDRHILMDGDIIVMMTDGISDYLSKETICNMVMSNKHFNPQQLAEYILQTATNGGAKDDSTVIVSRIFTKNH